MLGPQLARACEFDCLKAACDRPSSTNVTQKPSGSRPAAPYPQARQQRRARLHVCSAAATALPDEQVETVTGASIDASGLSTRMKRAARVPSFPFVRIAGQEEMKLALMLNVIDSKIGGVLIMGDRGTGKSVAVSHLSCHNCITYYVHLSAYRWLTLTGLKSINVYLSAFLPRSVQFEAANAPLIDFARSRVWHRLSVLPNDYKWACTFISHSGGGFCANSVRCVADTVSKCSRSCPPCVSLRERHSGDCGSR